MKAAQEMADQVLVKDLSLGDMVVGPRIRIFSINNSTCHLNHVLPSENPDEAVDLVLVLEYISRAMALNFFILPIPPRSGLGVIKV